MRELFILVAHLLTTLVRLMQPGGVRAVTAQSLALGTNCWCWSDGDGVRRG
jgi:hypothetical protein